MKKESIYSTIFTILKNKEIKKKFLIFLITSVVVYSFLYGLWKIPIVGFGINRLSEVGFFDYLFIILISALVSLLLSLSFYERKSIVSSTNSLGSSGGVFVGLLSAVCPVCQSIGIVAFGSTLLNIPTAFLAPYLGFLKVASLGLLGLAVYFKADSIYNKTCKACKVPNLRKTANKRGKELFIFKNNLAFSCLILLILLIVLNSLLIPGVFATTSLYAGGTAKLGNFEYGPKITLKPMPLAVGEQPKIAGYKSIVKPLPTISELSIIPPTGNAVQDLLNNIVPTGTPWYGGQAGVSFDDPIAAQNRWATYRSLQLSSAEQERWNRIANSFTCDYCCGSPKNPTIITRCGCAHAAAAQGMAKWFVKNYGSSYPDEEIYGEMARWYALWYPKGTIERIILEAQ